LTNTETAFLCAIYGLYLSDCIHWLGRGDIAFTRLPGRHWKVSTVEPLSFTLAGRRPLVVAPLLGRPGFIRCPAAVKPSPRDLRLVSRRLDRLDLLLTLCRLQAFLLLVNLPMLLFLHRLVAVWPMFLGLLLLLHIALCSLAICALRSANAQTWRTTAVSIALNPLGATRVFDALSQAFFDQQHAHRPRSSKSKQQ
jgi:hypothetical protein